MGNAPFKNQITGNASALDSTNATIHARTKNFFSRQIITLQTFSPLPETPNP
jgi:hypothetical protein